MNLKEWAARFTLGVCAGTLSVSVPVSAQTANPARSMLEPVTYLLPAPHTLPAFGPWMIAKHQGYFEDEGLDVTFITGKGGVDVAKQVGAGNALIGGALGDTPIIVRANGVPIKAVAILGAGSLIFVASHASAPITEPSQLKGKVISVNAYSTTAYYTLLATMQKAGLTRDDADIQAAGFTGAWQLFAAGKAQAMAEGPGLIALAEEAGAKVVWMPAEKNFPSMGQAILASDAAIEKHPDLVQRLVRATLRGMRLIMTDMDAAVAAYMQAVPTYAGREAYIRRVFDLYNRNMYANQKVLGWIDEERVATVQAYYVREGIASKKVPVKDLYTNQFVGDKK